jgi:hypothetical protein
VALAFHQQLAAICKVRQLYPVVSH